MAQLVVKNSVEIHARPERVWQVLTDPELTQKYMFGCRTLSEWKVGSPLLWEGTAEGRKIVYVKGAILALDPAKLLRYTVFDPNSGLTDTPSNYLQVTYALTPREGGVQLEVSQGDYASVENGQKRYQDSVSASGWGAILMKIKALAEAA